MLDMISPFAPHPTPKKPLAGLTVLVVEDSRFASEAVRLLCLHSGARARRADSLEAAHRHLRVYRPSVVICDMGLPDGSGADLIHELAHAEPRVPVLLAMSGDSGAEGAAMAAGADGFLAKPVESLGLFQQTILALLPGDAVPRGPRMLPSAVVRPGPVALADDLGHAAALMAAGEAVPLDYLAQFLEGVGISAHDAALEAAAARLAQARAAGRATGPDLARVAGLVRDRLAAAQAV